MIPGVILDLDQTLVDTSSLENHRTNRHWNLVYAGIPSLRSFPNIDNLITELVTSNIKVIIITTSISTYCKKIITHFNWQVDGAICYHDVRPYIKPHPKAFLDAVSNYSLDINRTISAGDRDIDILASKAANIKSIACTWASPNTENLLKTEPEYIANSSLELCKIIRNFHSI